MAVLGKGNIVDVAHLLNTDPSRLTQARNGRCPLSPSARAGFERELGVSGEWLRSGDGEIFLDGRSPDEIVEKAIATQLAHGLPRTRGVPVFDSEEAATIVRKEVDGWKTYATRPLMPSMPWLEDSFYICMSDALARKAGCPTGSYVLLRPAEKIFDKWWPECGAQFPALLRVRERQELDIITVISPDCSEEAHAEYRERYNNKVMLIGEGPRAARPYPLKVRGYDAQIRAVGIRIEYDPIGAAGTK